MSTEKKPRNHRKPLSRYFPVGHPRAGHQTYFVEKVWQALGIKKEDTMIYPSIDGFDMRAVNGIDKHYKTCDVINSLATAKFDPKLHTIRAGHNVMVGDTVEFYVWSGKPYRSSQIVVTPKIEVKKTWEFEILNIGTKEDQDNIISVNGGRLTAQEVQELAQNDGLGFMDMMHWFKFPKPFSGQIICWSDDLTY